jgi:alpha-beta hydrolase superfamily lysophospholipase
MTPNYDIRKLSLKDDYEGRAEATLIVSNAKPASTRAILYVHGYNDYFFQDHLAQWINNEGYNFYGLDMRKYGRSILPHQKPNMFRSVDEYFEELDKSIEIIRADGNQKVVLLGHSTGGLVTSVYLNHREQGHVDALVLNSPYFDNNVPDLVNKLVMPVLAFIGRFIPYAYTGIKLEDGFAQSISADYHGEWKFDTTLKPIKSFPLTFGWMHGLHGAQKQVHRGLDIKCPVLVLYASKSVPPGKYNPNMHTADAVLNVKHIRKYAPNMGKDVTQKEIVDGMHDLALSREPFRTAYFRTVSAFLKARV